VVNLWWVCGEACPLAGSYAPRYWLVKIFLVFEIYFWGPECGLGDDPFAGATFDFLLKFLRRAVV